jgi:hypothetical protein
MVLKSGPSVLSVWRRSRSIGRRPRIEPIPPFVTEDDFERRFRNWLSWCRFSDRGPNGRCSSLEGAYSGPQGKGHPYGWGDWDEAAPPKITIPVPVDYWDGLLVNRAYWQLGEKARRTILVIWFRQHWRAQWKAQKIGCHHTELEERAHWGKLMLRNRVRFLESKKHLQSPNESFNSISK